MKKDFKQVGRKPVPSKPGPNVITYGNGESQKMFKGGKDVAPSMPMANVVKGGK